MFQGLAHRFGDRLGFGLIALRGGEHHHEEREQQGDEIGIRDQPALVILVAWPAAPLQRMLPQAYRVSLPPRRPAGP